MDCRAAEDTVELATNLREVFTITEKALSSLLRHYAKQAATKRRHEIEMQMQRSQRDSSSHTFNQVKAPQSGIRVFSVIMRSSRTFVRSSIVHSQDIQRVAWHCLGHANCEEDANWCRLCKNMELTFASFSERIKWGDGNLQYGTDWHWLIATSNCRSLQCWTEMLYNIVGKESGPKMK